MKESKSYMYTRVKYVLCAACFFVILGCEKKSEAPSASEAVPTPVAEVVLITQSLSAPLDKAVVEIKDGNPCFSWAPLDVLAFESHILAVSTTPDFPTTRWQHKLNGSETSVCWSGGGSSSWVAKGVKPPVTAADLTPGVTYYWRISGRHSQSRAIVFSETRSFTMAPPSLNPDIQVPKE